MSATDKLWADLFAGGFGKDPTVFYKQWGAPITRILLKEQGIPDDLIDQVQLMEKIRNRAVELFTAELTPTGSLEKADRIMEKLIMPLNHKITLWYEVAAGDAEGEVSDIGRASASDAAGTEYDVFAQDYMEWKDAQTSGVHEMAGDLGCQINMRAFNSARGQPMHNAIQDRIDTVRFQLNMLPDSPPIVTFDKDGNIQHRKTLTEKERAYYYGNKIPPHRSQSRASVVQQKTTPKAKVDSMSERERPFDALRRQQAATSAASAKKQPSDWVAPKPSRSRYDRFNGGGMRQAMAEMRVGSGITMEQVGPQVELVDMDDNTTQIVALERNDGLTEYGPMVTSGTSSVLSQPKTRTNILDQKMPGSEFPLYEEPREVAFPLVADQMRRVLDPKSFGLSKTFSDSGPLAENDINQLLNDASTVLVEHVYTREAAKEYQALKRRYATHLRQGGEIDRESEVSWWLEALPFMAIADVVDVERSNQAQRYHAAVEDTVGVKYSGSWFSLAPETRKRVDRTIARVRSHWNTLLKPGQQETQLGRTTVNKEWIDERMDALKAAGDQIVWRAGTRQAITIGKNLIMSAGLVTALYSMLPAFASESATAALQSNVPTGSLPYDLAERFNMYVSNVTYTEMRDLLMKNSANPGTVSSIFGGVYTLGLEYGANFLNSVIGADKLGAVASALGGVSIQTLAMDGKLERLLDWAGETSNRGYASTMLAASMGLGMSLIKDAGSATSVLLNSIMALSLTNAANHAFEGNLVMKKIYNHVTTTYMAVMLAQKAGLHDLDPTLEYPMLGYLAACMVGMSFLSSLPVNLSHRFSFALDVIQTTIVPLFSRGTLLLSEVNKWVAAHAVNAFGAVFLSSATFLSPVLHTAFDKVAKMRGFDKTAQTAESPGSNTLRLLKKIGTVGAGLVLGSPDGRTILNDMNLTDKEEAQLAIAKEIAAASKDGVVTKNSVIAATARARTTYVRWIKRKYGSVREQLSEMEGPRNQIAIIMMIALVSMIVFVYSLNKRQASSLLPTPGNYSGSSFSRQ